MLLGSRTNQRFAAHPACIRGQIAFHPHDPHGNPPTTSNSRNISRTHEPFCFFREQIAFPQARTSLKTTHHFSGAPFQTPQPERISYSFREQIVFLLLETNRLPSAHVSQKYNSPRNTREQITSSLLPPRANSISALRSSR